MARFKNALTSYFIGALGAEPTLELAKWIATVEDDSDEETDDTAFYDGDGTPETDVISIKKGYTFEGFYDATDAAMKFVADRELATGEGRKIMFKQIKADGTSLSGPATLSEIITTGGDASDYETFECKITWDKAPVVTPPLAA